MKFSTTLLSIVGLAATTTSAAAASIISQRRSSNDTCITPGAVPDVASCSLRNFGIVLFRGFDMIDVFGTLDPLQLMAHSTQQMNLFLLSHSLDPVTTETSAAAMNPHNSSFWPVVPPTHTFDDAIASNLDIDVLIVPGGPGMRGPDDVLEPHMNFIRTMFPRVKIFMTVCTGSGLAARAGVLDGKLATTNKNAWAQMNEYGPRVNWVAPARYVIDGKVWSSSGVSTLYLFVVVRSRNVVFLLT